MQVHFPGAEFFSLEKQMSSMKYGNVPGINKPVSRIVQGSTILDKKDEAVGFGQLDAAFEAGINTIDTARIYGTDGFIGKWIASRGVRDKVVILGKGAHHNEFRKKVTPFDIGADLHDTLAAMKTDHIDLYVLHRDDPSVPVGPIVDALNQYQKEGKIGAFGGSNWTTARLKEANDYARAAGLTPFAVSSPNFSMAEQVEEPWAECLTISGPQYEADRKFYAEQNMPLFTWSSMAGGFWSGRFRRDNKESFEKNSYNDQLVLRCYASSENNFVRMDRAEELAQKKGVTLPQIALSYVLHYPLNIFALVAAANRNEIQANITALNTDLTAQEIAYLDLKADTVE